MTRSKGPAEEVSLPPTRIRKDVSTANEGNHKAQGQVQANEQSQQPTADTPSSFARPGSWAGTSTMPASEAGMQPAPSNPFTRPDSRAGFTPPKPTSPHSSSSSPMSGHQFQEDVNTSVSWDLIDTDTDMEVANINSQSPHQIVTNKNCADSSKESQNHTVGLNHQLNTLYNQDFFVTDTTGRRLSQIPDKSSYPSLLPNGNAALQLRLPDLLIYLKTDTYLVDVKSGHHYAMYPNRIEKMSVLPKLYAAWPYRQLLQTIHDDAVRFGVNSPEPTISKQSAPAVRPFSPTGHAEPARGERQPSPCKPTIVRYEPPSFNLQVPKQMYTRTERNQVLQNHVVAAEATFSKVTVLEDLIQQEPHNAAHYKEVQHIQRNQHIQVAIKLQHMLEADDKLRKAAGLPQLDLPEHLWIVRNMDTADIREQHFMAISSEAEVLCQQLKGKGMYPVPPTYTQITKPNVHFQPIQPAKLTPLQPQDRMLFDPLLHTTGGSTGSQSHHSNDSMQSYDTTPPKVLTPSPCVPEPTIPPTPYVNQSAVEQHTRAQLPPVPPRNTATVATSPQESQGTSVAQEPLITLAAPQQAPPQVQEQMTRPSHQPRKSKSKDGQGVKQSRNNKTTDGAPACWRCGEPGHQKRDCHKPPFCGKCRKEGHVPALCPLSKGQTQPSPPQQQVNKFSNPTNRCIRCGGEHAPASCPMMYQPKATPSTSSYVSPKRSTRGSQSTQRSRTPTLLVNNVTSGQVRGSQVHQVTPQVSPNAQQNLFAQPPQSNSFPPPPYFPIPFPPPPVPPSNVSIAPSAPASDLSAAISLMTNAVNQGNTNTTTITDALQRTTTQFADALQQTIQMGVDAQAEENKNARLDKQFDKIKIFDGSNPAKCHPWLEEVHALCTQMGRPFKEMLLLCAGQAVRDFIIDMALNATDEQIKNDLITRYSDLQGLGCKQAAYDNIAQRPDEPVRSYIVRYSRLFKLLNGTAPNEVRMRTTSMHFVNSLRSYLSSKVENRLLGMNERNYSLGDTFTVALQCELKAIASERRHNKRNTITINNVNSEDQDHTQLEDTQEVQVRNPNYKGKNYDPNYQARKTENKQQQQPTTTNNQYKAPYARPAANNNNNLASSSDIAGEVTLKTTVDGYQLLKMNELIKNAAAWRARMPKTGRFDKYYDNKETTKATPKVQINSATLQVMGQAAKDYGYTKDEFIEAVEMYEHFGNVNLEDVPAPSPQD